MMDCDYYQIHDYVTFHLDGWFLSEFFLVPSDAFFLDESFQLVSVREKVE